MKRLVYQIEGYTNAYNPEAGETERKLTLACVTLNDPTDDDIAAAARAAYNGEYTVEEDDAEETAEPTAQDDTDAMLIDHEYRLTLLELGVAE